MDFTREPIVETVMTPREGFRLVVRSSKNPGHEEHFVDALEVVTFGSHCFFRNIERPKSFLLPVSDYEVLEVREPKIVLKSPAIEGAVKIGGGRADSKSVESRTQELRSSSSRDSSRDPLRENSRENQRDHRGENRSETRVESREKEPRDRDFTREAAKEFSTERREPKELSDEQVSMETEGQSSTSETGRNERRRDRRRGLRTRGRKGQVRDKDTGEEEAAQAGELSSEVVTDEPQVHGLEPPHFVTEVEATKALEKKAKEAVEASIPSVMSSILAPPTTLIRDDIARLKANELYKGAFYEREEVEVEESEDEPIAPFIATIDESEEENFEDYRARPEPVQALNEPQQSKDSAQSQEVVSSSVEASHDSQH